MRFLFLQTAGLQIRLQERTSAPSKPELLPYEPAHVVAGRALAKRKAKAPEFSELLVDNFASGASSGAKVLSAETKQFPKNINSCVTMVIFTPMLSYHIKGIMFKC